MMDDARADQTSDPSGIGRTLIDVVASAGAAVDRAQVACDLLAHRIVGVVATTDPGRDPAAFGELRDIAGTCGQLAHDVAVLTRRYVSARGRHLDVEDALAAPLSDPVASEFDALERAGATTEDSAATLGHAVDVTERRLRARPAPGGTRPPLGGDPARMPPASSDDVLLN